MLVFINVFLLKKVHYCWVFKIEIIDEKKVYTVIPFNTTYEKFKQRKKMIAKSKLAPGISIMKPEKILQFSEFVEVIYYIDISKLSELTAPITYDTHLDLTWKLKTVNHPGLSFFLFKKNLYPNLFAKVSEVAKKYVTDFQFELIQPLFCLLCFLYILEQILNEIFPIKTIIIEKKNDN